MTTRPEAIADAARAGMTSVRWKIFFLLLGLVSINYIDRASLSIAMPMISREFSIEPAAQGLILSSFFWTYALMQIPGGLLADRFRPRVMIAAATAAWGLLQALGAAATSWQMLMLTRLGLGVAEAPIYPAGGKLNGMWLTPHERGRGAALLDGGAPLGAALGSLVIAWLIALFQSWRAAFLVAGIGTMLCGAWAWHYIRDVPRTHSSVNETEARYIEAAHAYEDAHLRNAPGGSVWHFFRYRSVWCMCLGWLLLNIVFYGLLTWMPTYLYRVHGFNIESLGNASFFIFIAGFVGELVGGLIADGWRARGPNPNLVFRTLFGVAAFVATVSIFFVAYVSDPTVVVLLLASTLFFLRWCGMYWTIPTILAHRDRAGFLGGCMNLGGNIGGIAVPIIVGAIVQLTASYFLALMFFAAAGLGLLACSLTIDYRHKLPV
jgi:ACS family D-galactonate transporter-like MFS transporter